MTTPPEPQPELEIEKLSRGSSHHQFVVVSFDGGVESKTGIMQHYLDVAKKVDGRFSFFVSGVYSFPDNKARLNYAPPKKPRGTSAIGFGDPAIIGTRINKLRRLECRARNRNPLQRAFLRRRWSWKLERGRLDERDHPVQHDHGQLAGV